MAVVIVGNYTRQRCFSLRARNGHASMRELRTSPTSILAFALSRLVLGQVTSAWQFTWLCKCRVYDWFLAIIYVGL
jgi:hypothetical protein